MAVQRKQKDYVVEIDGVDALSVQSIAGLGAEVDEVEHNEGGKVVKTPGAVRFPNITMTKVTNLGTTDNWAWEQLRKVGVNQNRDIDPGFEFNFTVRTKDNTEIWEVRGWVRNVDMGDLATMEGENQISTVEIVVNELEKVR
jgi:hypothetical protein